MSTTLTCDGARQELVGFQFGTLSDDARRALEAHLQTCPACVTVFLAVKRDVETAESSPPPPPELRARVRDAVARELRRPAAPASRRWAWWERPLAFACAGLTVFLAVLAVQTIATAPAAPPHSAGLEQPAP